MKLRNLTPHVLNVLKTDFTLLQSIPSENLPPLRVEEKKELLYTLGKIPVYKTVYGKCAELPAQEKDTFLIVSRMVIDAHPDREDLLCPCQVVRKDVEGNYSSHPFAKGDIIGCLGLSR